MLNLFRKAQTPTRSDDSLANAEQALIAEALIGASACLLGRPDAVAAARQFCQQIVEATPNITLAWVWFGDLGADVIEPQVAVGPACPTGERLRIDRAFFSAPGADADAGSGSHTRCFEVSPSSFHAPWRAAATSFGARSVLVVPIACGGDERGWLAVYAVRPKYFELVSAGLFETLGHLLHSMLVHLRQQVDRPAHDATDPVTGLPSRRHVKHQLEQAWQLPPEHETRGLMVMADLDQFQALNDRFGRMVGNAALRQAAQALLDSVRKTDVVARWGGDRFLVWLPGVSAPAAAGAAEKMRAAIARIPVPATRAKGALLAVSVGATPVTDSDSFTTAHDRADRALHRAKQVSSGCVVIARPGA